MEYYGLAGYPSRLAGADSLVGRVATPAAGRRPKPASRTTVANLLKSATEKVEAVVELPPDFVLPTGPEPDPMTRDWVRTPPAFGGKLHGSELSLLCRAAYESAFDLVCRSEHALQLEEALHRWAEVNAGSGRSTSPRARARLEPERRNAAHAMLAIVLWDIVNDEQELAAALRGDVVVAWSGIERTAYGGRVAVHSRKGVVTSDLNRDEFILLAAEVMNGNDDDGRASDLLLDVVLADRAKELFDAKSANTVLWAIGYGLASVGSWRIVELGRWYHRHHRTSLTTVSLLSWSAHVASLHQNDGLAWRLASACERILGSLKSPPPRQEVGINWQLNMVRSGCRAREAERFQNHERWTDAFKALQEASYYLRRARQASQGAEGDSALSKHIGNALRQAEIMWIAYLLRCRRHPAPGFSNEAQLFLQATKAIARYIDEASNRVDFDRGDLEIFRDRHRLLLDAYLQRSSTGLR